MWLKGERGGKRERGKGGWEKARGGGTEEAGGGKAGKKGEKGEQRWGGVARKGKERWKRGRGDRGGIEEGGKVGRVREGRNDFWGENPFIHTRGNLTKRCSSGAGHSAHGRLGEKRRGAEKKLLIEVRTGKCSILKKRGGGGF